MHTACLSSFLSMDALLIKEGYTHSSNMRPFLALIVFALRSSDVCNAFISVDSIFMPICGPGMGIDAISRTCVVCGMGFYQDSHYGVECKKCPGGTYSAAVGRTTPCDTCVAANSYMTDHAGAPNRCNCANGYKMEML